MGGDSQPQVLLQLLARLLAAGQTPAAAMAAGRWRLSSPAAGASGFDTWDGGGRVRVEVEGHAPAGWGDSLRAMGHDVAMAAPFEHGFGHAHAIRVVGDHLAGASDPRALTGAAAAW
jgi:gamma-glutamyltranspeptidase/glutathione hydrolase